MIEKSFQTRCGNITYWVNEGMDREKITLVFLPGLTADHRLFEKQISFFEKDYNVFVWDAPGHASSWPFRFDFDLKDKADWLYAILEEEGITNPVIIGQSMGGYVGQAFMQYHTGVLKGFVSIDSAPMQKSYMTEIEIWLLKHMEKVYYYYPWEALKKTGSRGLSESEYGQRLMYEMMMVYEGKKRRYAKLSGHGFKMLGDAISLDLPYKIDCPALLICGEKDQAGSAKHYNKKWHRVSGIRLCMIKDAGHNANTDKPEKINGLIAEFIEKEVLKL